MSSPQAIAAVLPPTWTDVLDRVQQAVTQAEAGAAQRARALEQFPQDPDKPDREAAWQQCLARLQERLAGLETCARRAHQEAALTETALEDVAAEVRRWREATGGAAQKLARGAAR